MNSLSNSFLHLTEFKVLGKTKQNKLQFSKQKRQWKISEVTKVRQGQSFMDSIKELIA